MKLSFLPWFALFLVPFAYGQKFTTFDIPNGTSVYPVGVSQGGEIVGYFQTLDTQQWRGFLRKHNGKFTTFDATTNVQTFPQAESLQGLVVGVYTYPPDYNLKSAFLRDTHGEITLFSLPGATQTMPSDVNSHGVIAGSWIENSPPYPRAHGFLRKRDGTITTVDAGAPRFPDTLINAINSVGQAVGTDDNADLGGKEVHGFLREVDGSLTTIDVLNAFETIPVAINAHGQVAGNYLITTVEPQRGFLRERDGTITTFNSPGGVTTGTMVVGIDLKGRVVGYYRDANAVYRAFVRRPDGSFFNFSPPGAMDTVPKAVNAEGVIVGLFTDAQNQQHGFMLVQ